MMRAMTVTIVAAVCVAAILGDPMARPALAQMKQSPSITFPAGFGLLYDGDYPDALRLFQSESRSSIKSAQSRWIDSICYEAMCGECYFQMGIPDKALQHFTNALEIYKQFPDWMTKVQFNSPTIRVAGQGTRKVVPWGATSRQSQIGVYHVEKLRQGQIDMTNTIKQGGVVQQANLSSVIPHEIVRCTALAMRRRAMLLGPVAKHDPLTADLMAVTARAIAPANHWSECWANLERGLALLAGGRDAQGVDCLQRAVLAAGEFDHPLTSVALLELGRQSLLHGDYRAASKYLNEASYAAVNTYSTYPIPDVGVLEEAFRYGLIAHLAANDKGPFTPVDAALQWRYTRDYRQLRVSLLLLAAENRAVLGQTREAQAFLDEARTNLGRRRMGAGWIGGRLNYLSALVAFQQKRIPDGNRDLLAAMEYMAHGSLWLFQINLADGIYGSGDITPRVALDLFAEVLRDPRPADWMLEPMESMAVLTTPHPVPLEHWFEAALDRREVKDVQTAIEIADRSRRHRFFSSLEFGGRVESLRWILEAPTAYLPRQAVLERQSILARWPELEQLSQQAQGIRAALNKKPLVADDAASGKEQSRQLADLASVGLSQEALLREIALRREPADMVFPPLRPVAEIQKALSSKQAALVFFATSRHWYGFLLNNERCTHWRINSPPLVLKQIQGMFREMGQFGQNHELTIKDLAATKWKQSAKQVLDTLLKGSPADFSQPFDELVIVPDGPLWYVPFDALQVSVGDKLRPLIAQCRVRYAPTLSLCVSSGPSRTAAGSTAVVLGKLYPRDADSVADDAFEKLSAVVPRTVAIRSLPSPSCIYSTQLQRLIVFDDIPATDRNPYGLAPMSLDRGKPGASLNDWLSLPWGGPDVVILPGFHTAAEDGLKRIARDLPGNDVFLSVCGLMANGARTLLISRWRAGGATSYDLVREFVQELPDASPADAWQRAVMLVANSRVNFDGEPRVKHTSSDEPPKANNPFFWAGFMLVDMGTGPGKEPTKPKEKPAEKAKAAVPKKKPTH